MTELKIPTRQLLQPGPPVSLLSEQDKHSETGVVLQNAGNSGGSPGAVPVRRPRSISKYGGVAEPPSDDSIFYVNDDDFGIFASVSCVSLIIECVYN